MLKHENNITQHDLNQHEPNMHIRPSQAQLQATRQSVHNIHSAPNHNAMVMWMCEWTPVVRTSPHYGYKELVIKYTLLLLLYTRCNPIIH